MQPSSQHNLEDSSADPHSHQFSDASDDIPIYRIAEQLIRLTLHGRNPEQPRLGLNTPDEMVAPDMLPHSAMSINDVWSVLTESVSSLTESISSVCRFFPFEIDSTSMVPSTRFAVIGKVQKMAFLGMLFALLGFTVTRTFHVASKRDYRHHHERKSSTLSGAPSQFPTAAPSPAPFLAPSPAPHAGQRVAVIQKCASQLSGGNVASPQERAVSWFVDGAGLRIPAPTICQWDSPFGMLYALIVIREALSVKETKWQTGQPLNSAANVCLWPRIHCQRGNITELSFNNAMLDGTLPPELSGLVHLTELVLFTNPALAGPIPTEMGRMSALSRWKIHGTSISGTVPTEIGNMNSLKEFLLHETYLTGRMPQEVCDLNLDALVATCDIIDCPCCTRCRNHSRPTLEAMETRKTMMMHDKNLLLRLVACVFQGLSGGEDPEQHVRVKHIRLGVPEAVPFLHRHHLIYSDLKPTNIGFDSQDRVKLFDFGLARKLNDGEENRSLPMRRIHSR